MVRYQPSKEKTPDNQQTPRTSEPEIHQERPQKHPKKLQRKRKTTLETPPLKPGMNTTKQAATKPTKKHKPNQPKQPKGKQP